jgi:tripartite-type tricarboxylate transporter receptor subunit TctC
MRTHRFADLLLALSLINGLHAQSLQWAQATGGASQEVWKDAATDNGGNIITVGNLLTGAVPVDLDPGPGEFNVLSTAASTDIMFRKMDSDGAFLWGGTIGGNTTDNGLSVATVERLAADGVTLLVTVDTVVTVNPRIYATLKFKADADLVPVIYLANTAQTLACHPSVPVKSVAELVAHARSHDLSYASGGQGVPGHLAAEMFLAATGVRMTHIPYKGPSAALQDLMGGNVHCGFLATPTVMPHVKSGKLTGLAVTSTRRSPIAMELPTMNEAGIAGLEASFGQLLLAPKGTPATVVAALNETFSAALAQADVRARMLAMDLEFVPNTPEQAEARLRSEAEKWARVVDRLGLRAD